MSNENDAPERIWAVTEPNHVSEDILGDVYAQQFPDGMVGKPVEYIREDLSHAKGARPKGCVAGCMVFDGGERRHHKDCASYPESLTKLWHDTEAEYQSRIAELEAKLAKAVAAFTRQGDNMAFVLNHTDTKTWYEKLTAELAEDRATLEELKGPTK